MKIFFRIISFVRPYWKRVGLSMVFTVFYSIFSGLSIYLFIPLLEMLFHPEKMATEAVQGTGPIQALGLGELLRQGKTILMSVVFSGDQLQSLLTICIIVVAAFLLKNAFGYLQGYHMNYVEEGVVRDLRNALYRHLHELPLGYFTHERTGDLISRITNDVALVNGGVSACFVTLVRDPLLILVFLGLAVSLSWKLTLLSLIVFPFALAIIGWIAVRLHRERGISQERLADITSVVQETISGVKLVKAFGMEEFETRKFGGHSNKYFTSLVRITRLRDLASPLTELLSVMAGGVIIWYGGTQVLVDRTLEASEFLGFLFLIFQIMPPVKELTSVNNRIQESSAAGKRIFEILDTEPSITSGQDAHTIRGLDESIQFRDVSFAYGEQGSVLRNISLTIKKGEVVAIVGPSGSGKTTLVDLIPRFYDPKSGSITLDGVDLRKLDVASLRAQIGIVTQETMLFNDTVRNNIAYGLDDCPMELVVKAARAANADQFIAAMPQRYDTMIGERGVKLSGGERQRLALARALLKNPPVLILDEATSALDTESEVLVQEAIERLMSGRTSIVIAHRLSTVQHADRIIVLHQGVIVESGTHVELLKNPDGLYTKLYQMQFRL